jgi:outer membrane lipopolysaccharide assembly protein LptE/RlpB
MKRIQTGMSSISLLLVLAACGFVLLIAFKIGPLYIDNYFVRASVNSLQEMDVRSVSDREVKKALSRYFMINGVRDISPDSATVERDTKHAVVKLDYEKRVPFFGNVDVVVRFENHFDTLDY